MYRQEFETHRHANCGNVPSNKTPKHVISKVRSDRMEGHTIQFVALTHGIAWNTAQRICADIIPISSGPLTSGQISGLMAQWL